MARVEGRRGPGRARRGGRSLAAASAGLAGLALALWWSPAISSAAGRAAAPTAYVTNVQLTSLSVYSGATLVGSVPNVGSGPAGIAIDPTGTRAYVTDYGFIDQPSTTVTPVDLAKDRALPPITVGVGPLAIAIPPQGKFAVVTLQGTGAQPGHQAVEINLRSRAVSPPVEVGTNPQSLAITPDGQTAWVASLSSAEITPVSLTWPPRAGTPIPLPGTAPDAIAISPDGRTAYVADAEGATLIPVDLATGTAGTPLDLVCHAAGDPGCTPHAVVLSPNGRTADVAAAGSGDVMVVRLPALTVARVLPAGGYPDALGLSGRWLFVADGASNTMTVYTGLRSSKTVGGVTYPFGVAVVPGSASGAGSVAAPAAPAAPAASAATGHAGLAPGGIGTAPVPAPPAPFYGAPAG
ncbi:MAG: YncE family protein [Acidimicrobiales bacterium]|nr:YncE family protein [Acidimicrobiales bacterium]